MRSQIADEWRAQEHRACILRALELRFRLTVPADVVAAVQTVEDLDELARWFDASQTANSLDEFRTVMDRVVIIAAAGAKP